MKLLIVTQKVDSDDPILGFFHNWILELSNKFEKISVICLEMGKYDLPENVKVFSLGKESKRSRIRYINNFFNLILGLHRDYDLVFVHMNQEYILLGGFIWKILGKKIYFWRNHQYGNFLTRIAVWLSNKVFCTSKFAFVTKYKKAEIMPVGIDTNLFKLGAESLGLETKKNKILFLGRMSSIKKPDLLVEALNILNRNGANFVCDFYGDSLIKEQNYYNSLKNKSKELGLEGKINFYKAVANYETPKIYGEHNIFVNLTPSGSFDKTILEASACGCVLVVTNKSLKGEIDERMIAENDNPKNIAEKISFWLNAGNEETNKASAKLQEYVLKNHSLTKLINDLDKAIKPTK
jgi:glycosyltransferase involved in cell wall biosynthesis